MLNKSSPRVLSSDTDYLQKRTVLALLTVVYHNWLVSQKLPRIWKSNPQSCREGSQNWPSCSQTSAVIQKFKSQRRSIALFFPPSWHPSDSPYATLQAIAAPCCSSRFLTLLIILVLKFLQGEQWRHFIIADSLQPEKKTNAHLTLPLWW